MEDGKLKVKSNGKIELKIGRNRITDIKTFDFSILEIGNYDDCKVRRENGKPVQIIVNGKDIPKNTQLLKERENNNKEKKECEAYNRSYEIMLDEQSKSSDSFELIKSQVPSDTRKALIYDGESFSLKLNKFARWDEKDNKFKTYFKGDKNNPKFQIIPNYGDTNFEDLTQRNLKSAKALLGDNCKEFKMSTNGRLITGLGGASVYETDITLHHVYGFPYLPASGIKGVVRSWIIQNVFGNPENIKEEGDKKSPLINAEFRALTESKAFCRIFGCPAQAKKIELDNNGKRIKDKKGRDKTETFEVALRRKDNKEKGQENQGKILFFDAFPTAAPNVVPEVMNPHYGPYYTGDGKTPPADYHNPIPIFFLTVDKKTEFQFILGSKDSEWLNWEIGKKGDEKNIIWWLKHALENHGIGAKTAVGYGYMSS